MEILVDVDIRKRKRIEDGESEFDREFTDDMVVNDMQSSPNDQETLMESISEETKGMDSSPKRARVVSRRLSQMPAAIPDLAFRRSQRLSGDVYVLGNGECGELGLGEDVTSRKKPTILESVKKACQIAAGGLHNLVLCTDGQMYSWGCNDQKVLARAGDETLPGLVEELDDVDIVDVAAGDSVSMALASSGKLYGWGTFRNSSGIIGFSPRTEIQGMPLRIPPEDVTSDLRKERVLQMAVGANHVIALTASHKIYTWGDGEQGQLGRKCLSSEKGLIPHAIGFKPPGKRYGSTKIERIFTGGHHAFACDDAGYVYAWGLNNYGQLGLNDRDNRHQPTVVEALQGIHVVQIDGGEHHSIMLTREGSVYTWGRGNYGQLGHGESEEHALVPRLVMFFKENGIKVKQVACGDHHSLALSENGDLYSWGYGEMLQLGHGEEKDERIPSLMTSKQLEGKEVLQIGAGAQHSLILARNK